jgi:hypothetical protein
MKCTTDPVTTCQPGHSVSTMSSTDWPGVVLNVSRCYQLPNKLGGIGRHKPLDGDGKWFSSSEEADEYCLSRGYTQIYRGV